jgi:hypothetical protein
VEWRLALPAAWDGDGDRRDRAGVPADERHRPAWAHALDALREVTAGWSLPTAPIVLPAPPDDLARLVAGLHATGTEWLVRADPATQVRTDADPTPRPVADLTPLRGRTRPAPGGPARPDPGSGPRPGGTRAGTRVDGPAVPGLAGDPVPGVRPAGRGRPGTHGGGRQLRPVPAWLHEVEVRLPAAEPGGAAVPCRVLVEWRPGRPRPEAYWLTSLTADRGIELVAVARRLSRSADRDARLARFGLFDFEGRSYRGWHHHTTLVSVALALTACHEAATPGAPGRRPDRRPGGATPTDRRRTPAGRTAT